MNFGKNNVFNQFRMVKFPLYYRQFKLKNNFYLKFEHKTKFKTNKFD